LRGGAQVWRGDVLNWAWGAGRTGKRLLPASLGHRAGVGGRGSRTHHAVDEVWGRGAGRLHRKRARAGAELHEGTPALLSFTQLALASRLNTFLGGKVSVAMLGWLPCS
jgi:hypothetical protein